MQSELKKWDKIEEIETKRTRYYQNKQIVSKKELEILWSVSPKTIQRYIKDGMPLCEDLWQKQFQIFFLEEVEEWKNQNINKIKSLKANKQKMKGLIVDIDVSGDDIDEEEELDIKEKIAEIKKHLGKTSIKNLVQEEVSIVIGNIEKLVKLEATIGELIPTKDVQKIIVEMVSGVVTGYKRNVRILPKECGDRSESEIREIMDVEFGSTIRRLAKVAKSEFLEDSTIYEILEVVYNYLANGYSPKVLIDKIEEL